MSNLQNSLNNKQEQLLQRFERDKASRVDTNKYANLDQSIGKVALIPVADIVVDDNCRKNLDTESVGFFQLMSSIKKEGILQNLVVEVRKVPEFKLICTSGQRRLIIAKMLGIEKVQCLIKPQTNNSDSLARSLDENILRENLSPLDLAESYYTLLNEGWDLEKIAERYDKDSRTIQYYINIAKFPEEAKNIIKENQNVFSLRMLMNEFAKKKWLSSDKLIEGLKLKISAKQSIEKNSLDESISTIEKNLVTKIGLKVKVQKNKDQIGGKITFTFKDDQELNKLLGHIS